MIAYARTNYRPRYFGRGMGAYTSAQLKAQTPGKQPSFITGSFPAASWTWYNDFNNGYGVYLPYTTAQMTSNGTTAANPAYVAANSNVTQQFSALLTAYECATTPSMCVNGQKIGTGPSDIAPTVWFPASASAPVAAPAKPVTSNPVAPNVPLSITPSNQNGPVLQNGMGPVYGGTVAVLPASSGFDLSAIPWWGWALGLGAAYMAFK